MCPQCSQDFADKNSLPRCTNCHHVLSAFEKKTNIYIGQLGPLCTTCNCTMQRGISYFLMEEKRNRCGAAMESML